MKMMNNRRERQISRTSFRRYKSRLKTFSGMPDMIAAINVMFLILVFFMLSSSFVQVSGIKVELPQVNTVSSAEIEKFIVSVTKGEKGSNIYFNDSPVNWEDLKEKFSAIRGMSRATTIVIRADKDTDFETAVRIMALAERANLSSFIAVMPQKEKQDTVFSQ